jgi:hypothetical protein
MTGVPGVDHPVEHSEAVVSLVGRNVSVSSRVESVRDGVIVVQPAVGDFAGDGVAAQGDFLDVTWAHLEGHRTLRAQVLRVDVGTVELWHLEATGRAENSQRRQAVRARVAVPVRMRYGPVQATGETVDLSEGGTRISLASAGVPPRPGAAVDLVIDLEGDPLETKGELVRSQRTRGGNWLLSVRFLRLGEKDEDRVRRQVFQILREERARESG